MIRLLELELASFDGDAFAAGLALAWSLIGDSSPWSHLRIDNPGSAGVRSTPDQGVRRSIDHAALAAGMAAVRFGSRATDRDTAAMVRLVRDQLDNLPLVLSHVEQDAVVTVLAAVAWATLEASAAGADDTLLA